MFCEKCGTAIEKDAVFCHECGAVLEGYEREDVKKKDIRKKNKTGWIIGLSVGGGVIALLLIIVIVSMVIDNRYIDMVKNGCPEAYPDTTYGEAFADFFFESQWKYFKEDKEDVVEFKGNWNYTSEDSDENEIVRVKIQFLIDEENEQFEIHTVTLNGKEQSDLIQVSLILAIFEEYENGSSDGILDKLEEKEDSDANGSDSEEEEYTDSSEYSDDNSDDYSDDESGDYSNDYSDGYSDDDYTDDYSDDDYSDDDYTDDYSDDDYSDDYSDDSYSGAASEDFEGYYVFEDSATRVLKNSELAECDAEMLRLGRNEIYARHGRRFLDTEIQSYFDNMPWYEGTIEPEDFSESVLNKYEKKNLKKIKSYENR